jgi:hypothetical protein
MRFVSHYRATIAFMLIIVAIGGGFFKLISVANRANDAAKKSREVATALHARVDENARTIRFLCDQSYVEVNVLDSSIAYRKQLQRTQPTELRALLIRNLEADRAALFDSLSNKSSPCNTG